MGQFQQAIDNSSTNFQPYMNAGQAGMQQLMAQMGLGDTSQAFDVTQLPGYQQSQRQGIMAVNQGAAGAGMLNSGERLKSLQASGQSVFGDYYNNYMNRLQGLTGQGLNAASSASNTLTNNLNAMTAHRSQQMGAPMSGSPVGDIAGAAASMFGTYMGSK